MSPQPRDAHSFVQAAVPEPFQILGLRLKPFSLGHYILLKRYGFVCDSGEPYTRENMILACLVCSMDYREFLEFIESPDYKADVIAWGELCGHFNLAEKLRLFYEYIAPSFEEPAFIIIGQTADNPGDWSQNLKLAMMLKLNATEEDILNRPLASLRSDYFRLAEMDGIIRIQEKEDVVIADQNAAIIEAALAAHAAKSASTANPQPDDNGCPA